MVRFVVGFRFAPDGELMAAVVALASAGRPELLAAAIANVDRLTGPKITKLVSVPDEASLPTTGVPEHWIVVTGTRGLAAQRNAALDSLEDDPIVFFFDDDAIVREDYVDQAIRYFDSNPNLVGLTGKVLLDGATTGEIPVTQAEHALSESWAVPASKRWKATRELYGCNFAVRTSAAPQLRFDARLPLYSWLEDHDFARRLLRFGVLAHAEDCVIVHRGASSGGRQSHIRLGYSQMMNPLYLWRKGSFPLWLTVQQIFRPVAKNIAYAGLSGQREWRRKRLKGNLLALGDVLRGRFTPERITDL